MKWVFGLWITAVVFGLIAFSTDELHAWAWVIQLGAIVTILFLSTKYSQMRGWLHDGAPGPYD